MPQGGLMNKIILRLRGSYSVSCEPENYTVVSRRGSLIGKMARELMRQGFNPKAEVQVIRDDIVCFEPMTLEAWSKISLVENDTSFRFTKYKPHPLYSKGMSND